MTDKREWKFFTLSEYEEEEKYLMDMARRGYILESVRLPGIYSFKKSEPVNMIYRLDFNPQNKDDRASYLQMYQDYGWDYIQDLNEYSYFCKLEEENEEANEIFSDNESRFEMMSRIMKHKFYPLIVLFCCCLIPQIFRVSDHLYSTEVAVGFYIFWAIVVAFYVFALTRSVAGFNRLKKKYQEE